MSSPDVINSHTTGSVCFFDFNRLWSHMPSFFGFEFPWAIPFRMKFEHFFRKSVNFVLFWTLTIECWNRFRMTVIQIEIEWLRYSKSGFCDYHQYQNLKKKSCIAWKITRKRIKNWMHEIDDDGDDCQNSSSSIAQETTMLQICCTTSRTDLDIVWLWTEQWCFILAIVAIL